MDFPSGTGADARNDSEPATAEANSASVAVPLLLNPAYARTKSIVHDELRNFRICLKWCALDHSSPGGRAASYAAFVALAVVLPAATSLSVRPPPSAAAIPLNQLVQLPESGLAAISFLTLAAFFRRQGLRQLLLLDGALRDDSAFVRRGYDRELDRAFRHLAAILLPSFSVELVHKILFFSSVSVSTRLPFRAPVPWNSVAFVATLASWMYRTVVFLLVCVLFRLTCELQILRFEGFYRMLEEEEKEEEERAGVEHRRSGNNAWAIFKEHLRIKRQLLVISHRYRIFIIGCMVIISVSQLGALMLVLASKSQKNFRNSDARNDSEPATAEANSASVAVPLLLNPAYARTKSIVHDELRNFRICLKWCALDHSSPGGRAASYAAFVALAVVLPAATSLSVRPPPSAAAIPLNQLVQLPESGLAAISFLTLAAFFRRQGLRQLLLLDGALRDDSAFVRRGYDRELDRAFRHLAAILLPSFSVELVHKILFFSSVSVSTRLPFRAPVPWNSVAFVATLASWMYRTVVFLLVCVLFRLTCELQILRFEGFYRMLEEEEKEEEERAGVEHRRSGNNAWAIFKEHLRIKRQLLVISHRYRIFIIGCMVIISHNGGGITLFGFALDRGLLHTLFAFEMTLVLWILSKVVVLA
ncbi:hypothetical protein COCNU_02G019830 [Cocos nucifera]|uniref:Uncharacterized protein n=1 Tax=Cocos nucifera TaxID=13894 RepID=A0A8K0MXL0_COCNU|nr:hypothetical protein COCNU_02G019830 [Cocos nucifera]